jgi:isoleucyl-tRNA synthetase
MYANIDGFTYSGSPLAKSERTEMDRWMISRLNTTVKLVDEYL